MRNLVVSMARCNTSLLDHDLRASLGVKIIGVSAPGGDQAPWTVRLDNNDGSITFGEVTVYLDDSATLDDETQVKAVCAAHNADDKLPDLPNVVAQKAAATEAASNPTLVGLKAKPGATAAEIAKADPVAAFAALAAWCAELETRLKIAGL
jgi:hypothetical protein